MVVEDGTNSPIATRGLSMVARERLYYLSFDTPSEHRKFMVLVLGDADADIFDRTCDRTLRV